MEKKRIFISVVPDLKTLESLSKSVDVLSDKPWAKGVKWIKKENIHITIKFIGDTDNYELEELFDTVGNILKNFDRFKIDVKDLILFPNRSKPRVIGVGVKSKKLKILVRKIENEIFKIGFKKENRKFKGHITLGRFKRKLQHEYIDERFTSDLTFHVKEVIVNESILRPKGPIYKVLKRFYLK
jgi:2'-5' RNA ligase